MSRLALYLLGPPRVECDGEPVHIPRRKAMALLAYLAVTGRAHQRDALATLLWPEHDQSSARAELRRTLSLLNRTLGAEWIITDRETAGLDPEANVWLDVSAFQDRLASCEAHDHPTAETCPECTSLLEEAAALYTDDFLAGFTLRDSAQFDEWQFFQTQSLKDQLAGALERLATSYGEQGEHEQAIAHARRWLSLDPLHEPAHRALMRLYAQAGQRAAALRQYEECERLLQEELSVAPQEETRKAYRAIKLWPEPGKAVPAHTIRGYELHERIGEGGFGVVYHGYQPSVGREVAIKVIVPRLANQPEFIRRFEAEAHLIARLEHPHIVPLYDYWREPDGAYLVMRWLRGGNLHQVLQRGPWAPEDAARLLDQVARALTVGHRQGIVHRDVKPQNILLDEQGNAYLADFGIAKDLLHPSGMTQTGQLVGSPAYISPEQAQSEPLTPKSDLYSLGVVMYEALTAVHPFSEATPAAVLIKQLTEPLPPLSQHQPDLPQALESELSAVLGRATAKDPVERYPDALAFAAAFRQAVSGPQVEEVTVPAEVELELMNPYKGLRPFEEADAADFFGRGALVERLLARFSPWQGEGEVSASTDLGWGARFLAVVGPSGSGKSSVVKAGLIPALRRGALPGSKRWYIVEVLPGAHPLDELEIGLLRVAATQPPGLMEQLARDERGLLRAARLILPTDEGELLLVIDQFEELYTRAVDEAERDHLLRSLHCAVTDGRSQVRVLITLRADFYDRPLTHPQFGELMRRRTEVVLPLTAEELAEAIRDPAGRAGAELEPGLVAAIVADVSEQPGALPMLQYALTELFECRRGRTLTREAYREIGGVSGALARRAEEVYATLDTAGQAAARQLYLRLVTLGEGTEDTRRRVLRSELEAMETPGITPGVLDDVIDAFGRSRLLLFDRDPATRVPTVQVAHEALLREWARLREWLDQSRADVRMQRLLAASAGEWVQAEHDPSYLLRGTRLAQFEGWATDSGVALTRDERAYLEVSVAQREARRAEEEARRQRELEVERQRAEEQTRSAARLRLRNRIISAVGIVALVALVVAVFSLMQVGRTSRDNADLAAAKATVAEENVAIARTAQAASTLVAEQRDQARRQAQIVVAQSLAGLAAHIEEDDGLAALLAVEAFNIAGRSPGSAGPMIDAALREILARPAFALTLPGHESEIMDVAFSPDGQWLASGGFDNTVRLFSLAAGHSGEGSHLLDHEDVVSALAFSPDGRWLASGSWDATIRLWSVADPAAEPYMLPGQEDKVAREGIAFSPDGRWLAVGGHDDTVRLWDLGESGDDPPLLAPPRERFHTEHDVISVAFSPDGQWLAVSGESGTVYLWDMNDLSVPPREFLSAESLVLNVTFSPDGRWLASASADGIVRLWDVALVVSTDTAAFDQGSHIVGRHDSWANSLAFSPDGRWLASASSGETVRLWDLSGLPDAPAGAGESHVLHGPPGSSPNAVAFGPDGRWVAAGGADHSVWMWHVSALLHAGTPGPALANGRVLYESGVRLTSVAWSQDGAWLAGGGYNQEVHLWSLVPQGGSAPSNSAGSLVPQGGSAPSSSAGPSNSGSGNALLPVDWVDAPVEPRLLRGHTDSARSVALSPDGRWLASGGDDHTVRIWSLAAGAPGDAGGSGAETLVLRGHEDSVTGLAFHPSGRWLASGSLDQTVRLWTLRDKGDFLVLIGEPQALGPLQDKVTSVAFDQSGRWLASGSVGGTVSVWSLDVTGEALDLSARPHLLTGHEGAVATVAFSPDGRWLISGGADGKVRLWDLGAPGDAIDLSAAPQLLGAHEGAVTCVSVSDDGRWVASASADGTMHLWDLGTSLDASPGLPDWTAEARVLGAHQDAVTSVAFGPGGRRLISVGLDGTVRLWVVPLEELADLACQRIRRNLTPAEWQRYLPGEPYRKTCSQWPLPAAEGE